MTRSHGETPPMTAFLSLLRRKHKETSFALEALQAAARVWGNRKLKRKLAKVMD